MADLRARRVGVAKRMLRRTLSDGAHCLDRVTLTACREGIAMSHLRDAMVELDVRVYVRSVPDWVELLFLPDNRVGLDDRDRRYISVDELMELRRYQRVVGWRKWEQFIHVRSGLRSDMKEGRPKGWKPGSGGSEEPSGSGSGSLPAPRVRRPSRPKRDDGLTTRPPDVPLVYRIKRGDEE